MKPAFLATAAFLALSFFAVARAQDAQQDFTLVNDTGYDIKEVYVSPSKSNNWEEDILGEDSLADGDEQTIHFRRAGKTCNWDLKVVYTDDDSSAVWGNINLCKVAKITIKYNRKTDTTTAFFD